MMASKVGFKIGTRKTTCCKNYSENRQEKGRKPQLHKAKLGQRRCCSASLALSAGSCYRHFCASRQGAWNVNNYRDPQSLNMLFLPLKEQGHQTTALPISSPPENTSKQAIFGSCQLLH